ncbi:GntR family transcriptional regulator [Streptomyces griseorubiginosus]|uniref:GntR family transcriptional regulator n=1 Tax=Streptomyces griseorubiginosus TaxID=67304 RepID=UPI001AD7C7FA|nr:GntR family transcriptional regulator [Streptomyces griseorubiginosus]MBO4259262.1 GntR family transcriptional regulator [Streptomyces griseorubiginosus]
MSAERGAGAGKGSSSLLEALRGRIAEGSYAPGSHLPPQRALAEEFDVSRDTVQKVLGELKSEGWIDSKQGSGSWVVDEPPIHSLIQPPTAPRLRAALGPFIARAFGQPVVQLDVFTFTSESLDAHIRLQSERIRLREIRPPERIELRMLLPDDSIDLPYPRARRSAGGPGETSDIDHRLQDRMRDITRRHTASLRAALRDLGTEGLVPSVRVDVRRIPLAPPFKLYLMRDVEALFGPYRVVERSILLDDETEIQALDVLGLGSTLTRHVNDPGDPNSTGSVFMESWQAWYDSWWTILEPPS